MLPTWLGVPYCILYSKYVGEEFKFEDAKRELGISTSKLLKVLSGLGKRGFLASRVEGRSGRYFLSSFERFALGVRAGRELEGRSLSERLKLGFENYGVKYLVVGGSAAFLYHAYQFPVRYEVEVFAGDYGFWRNLIPEAELIPRLTEESFGERKEMDGVFVAPPERVIAEGLEDGGVSSILDSVSVLVSERGLESLDWKRLGEYAVKCDVTSELGVILEILSTELMAEYGVELIPKDVIQELLARVSRVGRMRRYPKTFLREDKTYYDIGRKWRLKLYLPSYTVRKPLEDLAPLVLGGGLDSERGGS
jgi:hypothetical protein